MHTEIFPNDLEALRNSSSPGAWFISACDEKFTNEDLNDEGNDFAKFYYNMTAEEGAISYLFDYSALFPENKSLYYVPDTWDTYGKVEPVVCARFKAWRDAHA